MEFFNIYEDIKRAEAYSTLEFPGTYYLAYRDLPQIISEHVKGRTAIDFGCGAGRSTRFLKKYGFHAIGVDIAKDMIAKAREMDPAGDYYLIADSGLSLFDKNHYDLVLSIFTLDNIPDKENRAKILRQMGALLNDEGWIVLLDSTPEIYQNEWASFTTKDFLENKHAKSGETVKIIMTDVDDQRPVEDIIWFDEDYQEIFKLAGLELVKTYKPLGKEDEPYTWVNETRVAPWIIYVLKRYAT